MATAHYTFAPSIPANTAQAAPVEITTAFNPGRVSRIIVVTPGSITTGIQVAVAHQQAIPTAAGQFLVSSNTSQNYTFTPRGFPDTGAWSVFGYNTAATVVQWYIFYDVEDVSIPTRKVVLPRQRLPAASVYGARLS